MEFMEETSETGKLLLIAKPVVTKCVDGTSGGATATTICQIEDGG